MPLRLLHLVYLFLLLLGLGSTTALAQRPRPKAQPAAKAKPRKAPVPAPGAQPNPEVVRLLAEAHSAQKRYRDSEALALFEQVLGKEENYEALWQAAVLSVRIGSRYTDETRKGTYFASARSYADRALGLHPYGGESNYATALAIISEAPLLTARGRLLAYKEMKPYISLAVERCPTWADAWQLLGRWHFRVDHYNVFEKVFSHFFLHGRPGGASTEKAVEALLMAQELEPTRIGFCYDLARVYQAQHELDKAIAVLLKASTLMPATTEEMEVSRRCHKLLEVLSRKHSRLN
ncbi:hypothetical protein LJY25_00520 [Hymenobacter sp. BT175]|uniref:tetratricopeptide repeat protein n=1 Tax=Hymenobacter translucens TaxID=2886507 RepID=UPI001D0E373E|nr:hypothetical protein [Hymenobacter translucens]MCC2544911.1 hypothetical protein [Hymenobacter translucens]